MAKFNGNQKCWMEVAVPAILMTPNKISVSPQLETIFEEEDFQDSDFLELLSSTSNSDFFPNDFTIN
ncbi:unnamed protein product [Withania somnifera]